MRRDKYKTEEKRLCHEQEQLITQHTESCHICKTSFQEYTNFGISHTPPCNNFTEKLRDHISNCSICSIAEKKWNEDAIPTTKEMRQITAELSKGKIPDISLLKKVSSYLIKELNMSSDEIHDMNVKAEDKVRKSLDKGEKQ